MTRRKEITSKLPWAAAATIIVVAAVGAWALLGQAPAGPASITGIVGAGTVFAGDIPAGNASGIENIYIIATGAYVDTENISGDANILGVITVGGGFVDIDYGIAFDIIVAVKVGTENMASVVVENMNVGLGAYGSFTITDENIGVHANAHMASAPHENSGYGTSTGWLRINAIWDNNGTGYTLSADGTLNLENIMLWGWK